MGVLLDTRDLPAADRADSLRTALLETSGASQVHLRPGADLPQGRLSLLPLGDGAVFTAECNGVRLVRDARSAREGFDDVVAIAVHGAGTARHADPDGQRLVRTGDLMLVDLTRPFDVAWDGHGSSTALQLPRALLGVSVDDVHRAGSRLTSSRLHDLVRGHLLTLAGQTEQIGGSPATPLVTSATAQLVRALLTDVTDRGGPTSAVTEETLVAQVREYVRLHLREPELGPDSIAAALAVSRRHLFRLCSAAGFSVEQHVISARLRGARDQLATSARPVPIGTVARGWGFKDVDHFARRFKAEFGVTPGAWHRENLRARRAGHPAR